MNVRAPYPFDTDRPPAHRSAEIRGPPRRTAVRLNMATVTEADGFSRVIDASNPTPTPDAAAGILQPGYSASDHARVAALAGKSNAGALTRVERRELESYVFVGDVLPLLKSKARLSLRKHSPAA